MIDARFDVRDINQKIITNYYYRENPNITKAKKELQKYYKLEDYQKVFQPDEVIKDRNKDKKFEEVGDQPMLKSKQIKYTGTCTNTDIYKDASPYMFANKIIKDLKRE